VYALADQWFIPGLEDFMYDKKLDTTYEEMVKKSNSEDKEPEGFWTDLFNAVKEAYDSHPPNDTRVRINLLNFVS